MRMIHVRSVGMVRSVWRAILLGLLAVGLMSADSRVRLGGVTVGASYSSGGPGWWGPPGMWGPYWGPMWGYYNPYWYGPWLHPGYARGFVYGPGLGEVKLKSTARDALVLIDGAYAGEAKELKSMWLEPGVYNLELRDDAGASFSKRIYVLSGKTLRVQAKLDNPAKNEEKR